VTSEQFRLLPECSDERRATAHATECGTGMVAELAERLRAQVRQFVVLPVAPHVLDRIELGGVARKILQHDPAVLRGDVVAHDPAPVGRQAVPDDEQLPAEMALEVGEELDDLRPLDWSGEEPKVEIPPRDPGDRREQVPVEVVLQDRRLSTWGPGPAAMRPLGQSALVDEDDRLPLGGSVFFNAGQRTRFQWRIAASSRSSARPVGRWQLQPSRLRSRQTWLG